MPFPEFFHRVPGITLRDPLAELLGAAEDGLIDYEFIDAVKLTGHACPTVAGAWLMTVRALRQLYGEAIPERGNLVVALHENRNQGVAGVIASVATLLTGAAGDGGFKGLAGRHARCDLLHFGVAGVGGMAFYRRDNGAGVDCTLDLAHVPPHPDLPSLLPAILAGKATPAEQKTFAAAWQDRVRRILIEHHDDPQIVRLRPAPSLAAPA